MFRKKLPVLAIVLTALLSFFVLSGSASAASAHSHTGSQAASKQVTSQMMLPANSLVTPKAASCNPKDCPLTCDFNNCPPEGRYDTGMTFCDGQDHSWWGGTGSFYSTFWDAGTWHGRIWVTYDAVFCTFMGCWDFGIYYRWC